MGLAERRVFESIKEKEFVTYQKDVRAAAGFPVAIDVKWDTMTSFTGSDPKYFGEWFGKVYFKPLVDALKAIAVDEMGKEALKKGLKKVVVDGTSGSSASTFTFKGGELVLLHKFDTNVDDVAQRAKAIQKLLENNL